MKNFYTFLSLLLVSTLSYGQISEGFDTGLETNGNGTGTFTLSSGTWQTVTTFQETDPANIRTGVGAARLRRQPSSSITTPILTGAGTVSFWYRRYTNTRQDLTGTISLQSSTDGTNYTTLTTRTYSNFSQFLQLSFQINDPSNNLTIRILSDGNGRVLIDDFEVTAYVPPVIYTYTAGTWSPADPNATFLRNHDELIIESGDATLTANSSVKSVTVNPGASLTIGSGVTLTTVDVTNGLTLESTSAIYSSLINDGTIVGTINYERFVNAIGSGATGTGGNDLISAPVGTDNAAAYLFQDLLNYDNNINLIANNNPALVDGTQFAFAPYNNTTVAYENYVTTGVGEPPAPSSTQTIVAGKGYRVATTGGANVSFTGGFSSATVGIAISSPLAGSQWNLIGNPYPSYISSTAFLSTNTLLLDGTILDPAATAIYGYNSGTYSGLGNTAGNFTIINNNTNSSLNIAPGQGFFVASNALGGTIQFSPSMRTTTGSDDFIEGRSAFQNYKLILGLESTTTFSTSFYFNENSSLGLDPGYDAAAFGENANNSPLYSHLVEDNTGRAMSMQSLGITDFEGTVIPLGVNSSEGTQITFNINETTLPNTVQVYLEDKVANTLTLLNTSDYVLTPTVDLSGTGRFFLRFAESALSDIDNSLDALNIYTNATNKTIVIAGQLSESTTANIYDLQGRLVTAAQLETSKTRQSIDVSNLSTGVYVIQLTDASASKSQKLIIR